MNGRDFRMNFLCANDNRNWRSGSSAENRIFIFLKNQTPLVRFAAYSRIRQLCNYSPISRL
jgi:hypothetical protein